MLTNAQAYAGRVSERGTWRGLLAEGIPQHWRTGPRLCSAQYPDVLVARAVTDGRDLQLVLRPGNGYVRTELEIDRLVPGTTYRLAGATQDAVTADRDGTARVTVDLDSRVEIHVVPTTR